MREEFCSHSPLPPNWTRWVPGGRWCSQRSFWAFLAKKKTSSVLFLPSTSKTPHALICSVFRFTNKEMTPTTMSAMVAIRPIWLLSLAKCYGSLFIPLSSHPPFWLIREQHLPKLWRGIFWTILLSICSSSPPPLHPGIVSIQAMTIGFTYRND